MSNQISIYDLVKQLGNTISSTTKKLEVGLQAQYAQSPSQFRNIPFIYKKNTSATAMSESWDDGLPWPGEWPNIDDED